MAEEVHLKDALVAVHRLRSLWDRRDARVVQEHVERRMLCSEGLCAGAHARKRGEVELKRLEYRRRIARAYALRRVTQPLERASSHHDRRSLLCQALGCLEADAGVGAGDEHSLAAHINRLLVRPDRPLQARGRRPTAHIPPSTQTAHAEQQRLAAPEARETAEGLRLGHGNGISTGTRERAAASCRLRKHRRLGRGCT